jgi:type VI secretion system protein ImpF
MIDSVRRDLEELLNTHRTCGDITPEFSETLNSVLTYGLPDLVSLQANNPEVPRRVAAAIEETIDRFEPRLKNVRVATPDGSKPGQLKLEFQIHATLKVDPAPEVSFVTVLELTTGETSIRQAEE